MRALLLVVLVGCAESPTVELASRHDSIRGGTVVLDGGYPSTFMIRTKYDTGAQSLCTGTLITSRTILTAAHCFAPAAGPPGATSVSDVYVTNTSPDPGSASPLWLRIEPSKTRVHPSFTAGAPQRFDVALAVLPSAFAVAPTPALTRAPQVNAPLEVVGFGVTAFDQTDSKIRRAVMLPLKGLTAEHLQLGDGVSKGICNGDSGGPSFIRGRDGVLRVAGIHSYDSSRPNCNDGLDTRVDLFAAFIQQFIRDEEGGASCGEDGQCASGCPSADVDCVCQSDGSCNGACPNLLTDADCPADCVGNGICATQDCPRLDPDCVAELAKCTSASQCQHRICADDPQRADSYCSKSCSAGCASGTSCVDAVCLLPQLPTADAGATCTLGASFCLGATVCAGTPSACRASCSTSANCTAGECVDATYCQVSAQPGASCTLLTRCLQNTVCTGLPGDALTCRLQCASDASCLATERCDLELKLCRLKPISLPSIASAEMKPPSGCNASPGALMSGLFALAWLMRRRPYPRSD